MHTDRVLKVVIADGIFLSTITYAGASGLGDDGGIDGNDIAHGHERREAGSELDGELGSLDFFLLLESQQSELTIQGKVRLTWPLPSSLNTRPNVVRAIARLRLSIITPIAIV